MAFILCKILIMRESSILWELREKQLRATREKPLTFQRNSSAGAIREKLLITPGRAGGGGGVVGARVGPRRGSVVGWSLAIAGRPGIERGDRRSAGRSGGARKALIAGRPGAREDRYFVRRYTAINPYGVSVERSRKALIAGRPGARGDRRSATS